MKLSLITPVYREAKDLQRFLERLTLQTNENFEAIFVIDTNNENVLKLIDDFTPKIKGKLKVIFNSKRGGRTEAVYTGIENATGEYSVIFSVTNSFDERMVDTVLAKLDAAQYPDILEFNARFKDPIKYDGTVRKQIKTAKEFDKDEIFAYTYPFDFNKIYKTTVLVETTKLPSLSKRLNSRFTVELACKALLVANTYASTKTKIVRSKKSIGTTFNPLKISREWDELISQEAFSKYKQSLEYNRYFVTKILYVSLAATTKNKVLVGKMNELIKTKFEDQSNDFFATNRFMLSVNKESETLKKFKNQPSDKAFKALND